MVPLVGCRHGTSYPGRTPGVARRVPDVPLAITLDVALGSENEFHAARGLIGVKFEGLRKLRCSQVEIQIVLEMGLSVVRAELLPPNGVRVRRSAADVEPGGTPA